MRAELGKSPLNIVFVWAPGITANGSVQVYTYKGMAKVSHESYDREFARHYWRMLLTQGYRIVPNSVPQIVT